MGWKAFNVLQSERESRWGVLEDDRSRHMESGVPVFCAPARLSAPFRARLRRQRARNAPHGRRGIGLWLPGTQLVGRGTGSVLRTLDPPPPTTMVGWVGFPEDVPGSR